MLQPIHIQKEVGEKIIADLGDKNYSRLSIITKSRFKIMNFFYVSKNCFFPKPKVDSIVIEFKPVVRNDISFRSIKISIRIEFSIAKSFNMTYCKLKIIRNMYLYGLIIRN